jgi:DNA-binding MarR family transcriptional regulator
MRPDPTDVQQLAAALFTVSSGLERARRQIPDAAALSVLQVLGWAEGAGQRPRPSEIATALGVHRSAVTHHLQALERAGQVMLTVDPADRRSCFVALTETGRRETERLTQVGIRRFTSFVQEWDAEEVRTLTRLLVKFDESKNEFARRHPPPSARNRQDRPGQGSPS